eukprot:8764609-Pyramimonas_sp.AAC.1
MSHLRTTTRGVLPPCWMQERSLLVPSPPPPPTLSADHPAPDFLTRGCCPLCSGVDRTPNSDTSI